MSGGNSFRMVSLKGESGFIVFEADKVPFLSMSQVFR
jgi:hypothetical protein